MSMLLAHQGGWDEILLIAGPIALAAVAFVVWAERKARIRREQLAEESGTAGGDAADQVPPGS